MILISIDIGRLLFNISHSISYEQDIPRPKKKGNINLQAKLSRSEVLIFQQLYNNIDEPVSRSELLKKGWPDRVVTENSLSVAIRSLRSKVNNDLISKHISIDTIPGLGYCLMFNKDLVRIIFSDMAIEDEDGERYASPTKKYSVASGLMNIVMLGQSLLISSLLWFKVSIKVIALCTIVKTIYLDFYFFG